MNPYNILQEPEHEGKFTAQFKARKPHLRNLKSLEEFAHYILAHPTEFNKISKQRANFYKNLIEKHGAPCTYKGSGNQNKGMTRPMSDEDTPLTEEDRKLIRDIDEEPFIEELNRLKRKEIKKKNKEIRDQLRSGDSFDKLTAENTIKALMENSGYGSKLYRGKGRISPMMMDNLRAYHRQVGGKISAKDFELMLKETYKTPAKRDKHIGDYYIDESLSTPENVVYHNPKTGETKVAYRGTEGTLKDWGNNALYAMGLHNQSKRYKRAADIEKKVEQKYGTENLDVLGHSQSGAFAQEIGKNAKNTIVLNPASHPLYSPKTKNATIVRSKGDSVSALKYLNPLNWGKKADIEIEAKTYNPVTEHMPSVLERLPENTILGNGRGGVIWKKKLIKQKKENTIKSTLKRTPYKLNKLLKKYQDILEEERDRHIEDEEDEDEVINKKISPQEQDMNNIIYNILYNQANPEEQEYEEEYIPDFKKLLDDNKYLEEENVTIDKDFLKKLKERETGQIKQIGQKTGLGRKRKIDKKLRNLCCCGMVNCPYC